MDYKQQVKEDRRAAALERAALRDAGLSDGYTLQKAPEKTQPAPLFREADEFRLKRLTGGLKASLRAERAAATRRRRKYAP